MFTYDERIAAEQEIAVPAENIWNALIRPNGLTQFHPFIEKHVTERWDGVGSTDHVKYYSGLEYDREIIKWIEGTGFDVSITQNKTREIRVMFRVTPIDAEHCKLNVTIHIEFIKKLPFPLRWLLLKTKIKPAFYLYLDSVLKGLAYHTETRQQVVRNQFGPHPIMSP